MSVKLLPYLIMDGNAAEAIEFYQKALKAKVLYTQAFGDMPENPEFPVPEEAKQRIAHATIQVGETEVMLSDTFPGQPHQNGNQVAICISTDDPAKASELFEGLSNGGNVTMPLQETFFSPAYGIVTDKFGVNFQIHTQGD
ncbi:VOC family protein [Oceanobacillus kapialis]|uniref:VOC family protein n=1 Tax=Oceanobacillus kapialis TaxID=481353 RepID=A0ABW5Q384_9BACI